MLGKGVFMQSLSLQFRQAFRSLSKAPAFSLTTVSVLALGIGIATAMFSVLHSALLQPLPYPDAGRLMACSSTIYGTYNPMTSAPDYYDYRERLHSFQAVAAQFYGTRPAVLPGDAGPETASIITVSDNFFQTLGVRPLAGRSFLAEEGRPGAAPAVILCEGLAIRRFGSPAEALGRTLVVDNLPRTVVGVMPASFRFLTEVQIWSPMSRGEGEADAPRNFHNWNLVGRLRPDVTPKAAQIEADAVSAGLEATYPELDKGFRLRVDPLQDRLVVNQKPRLYLLMGAVGLLLVIASSNVAGLLFVRGVAKVPEYAVRAALGADRRQLVIHILAESLILSLVGGLLGCILAFWLKGLIPLAGELGSLGIPSPQLSLPVLAFALGASLGSGLLFGLIPALRVSQLTLSSQLAPTARTTESRRGVRTRNALVVAQVALALVLLVLTGLLGRSLHRTMAADPGFNPAHLLATPRLRPASPQFKTPEDRIRFFRTLQRDLAALPGVQSATATNLIPLLEGGNTYSAWTPSGPRPGEHESGNFHLRVVLPGYFASMGIPLLAGRDLGDEDRKGTPGVMVVNQRVARTLFPGANPVGQTLLVDLGESTPTSFQIVGVAGDVRLEALDSPADLAIYASYDQLPRNSMRIVLRTTLPAGAMTAAVRSTLARIDPAVPLDSLVSVTGEIRESLAPQRQAAFTMGVFSGAALLLSSLGLFSVLTFVVGQRTREIGVRLALGAQPAAVLRQILGESLVLTALGIAFGYLVSLAAARSLASQLYEVRPADPLVLILAALAVSAVSLAAALLPAWKASRLNPMDVLRAS
jgi:putative ABC transport system permease protein